MALWDGVVAIPTMCEIACEALALRLYRNVGLTQQRTGALELAVSGFPARVRAVDASQSNAALPDQPRRPHNEHGRGRVAVGATHRLLPERALGGAGMIVVEPVPV